MRRFFILACLFSAMFQIGCSSSGAPVKQLNESSARRMITEHLSGEPYRIGIASLLPFVVAHTRKDYTKEKGVLSRLIAARLMIQRASSTTYPKISGDFFHETKRPTTWLKEHWILESVPGSNDLEGKFTTQRENWTGPAVSEAKGTIQADGKVVLRNMTFAWAALPAQYYEQGGKAYLKFHDKTFVGPATGQKVAVTWYAYTLSPDFEKRVEGSGDGRYVVGGNFVVGAVTNLRLATDTEASANFAWQVSLNSTGKLFHPENAPKGTGAVLFGKKPDQTWAIDSVSGLGGLAN